jgi:hypothetical protein
MITLIRVSLYIFTGCAALGMVPVAIIAARERKLVMVVFALLIAAYVMFVLIAAAAELPRP